MILRKSSRRAKLCAATLAAPERPPHRVSRIRPTSPPQFRRPDSAGHPRSESMQSRRRPDGPRPECRPRQLERSARAAGIPVRTPAKRAITPRSTTLSRSISIAVVVAARADPAAAILDAAATRLRQSASLADAALARRRADPARHPAGDPRKTNHSDAEEAGSHRRDGCGADAAQIAADTTRNAA